MSWFSLTAASHTWKAHRARSTAISPAVYSAHGPGLSGTATPARRAEPTRARLWQVMAGAITRLRATTLARHSAPGVRPAVAKSVHPAPECSMSVWRLARTAARIGPVIADMRV